MAVVEHGAVQELHIERTPERGLVGNVYLGKVSRVLPGMQSAFIDIGLERAAFCTWPTCGSARRGGEAPCSRARASRRCPSRSRCSRASRSWCRSSRTPLAQGRSPVHADQRRRAAAGVSAAGRPYRHLAKIPVAERDALRAACRPWWATRPRAAGRVHPAHQWRGFDRRRTGRRHCLPAQNLGAHKASLRLPPHLAPAPGPDLLQRVLRDLVGEHAQSIRIDSTEQFHRLRAFGREFMPQAAGKLQHYRGERPIFDLYSIDEEIARALGRRVDLKSGGYLIIDQTEALTTVDVNTGGYVGARNFDDTIFKTNLEGCGRHCAPAAPAQPGRHHHRGLHRHGPRRPPGGCAHRIPQTARARPRQNHVGGFAPGPGGNDAQAHARIAGPHAVRPAACARPGCRYTARSVAYDILREICEGPPVQPREFRVVASPRVVELLLDAHVFHCVCSYYFRSNSAHLLTRPAALRPVVITAASA